MVEGVRDCLTMFHEHIDQFLAKIILFISERMLWPKGAFTLNALKFDTFCHHEWIAWQLVWVFMFDDKTIVVVKYEQFYW